MHEFICGAVSGVFQTMVGYPFDTYKVLMQNNQFNLNKITRMNPFHGVRYPLCSSIINCSLTFGINDNLKKMGKIDTFLTGFISGISISPIVFYFDYLKINRQIRNENVKIPLIHRKGFTACSMMESFAFAIYFKVFERCKENIGLNSYISGGVAGLANWTCTYPIDVIKTRQLIHNIRIVESIKMGSLWKGYMPCAIRAVIVNSLGFYIYDEMKERVL